MKYWEMKREDLVFTVVFYGLKNFGCKNDASLHSAAQIRN